MLVLIRKRQVMVADYHIHTTLCKHARGAVPAYHAAARTAGLPELGFADHAPAPDGYDAACRMTIAEFPRYQAMVSELPRDPAQPVRFGIEADYYEGGVPFLERWLPAQEFDFVLGSIHYIGDWPFDNPDAMDRWESADIQGVWTAYFELVAKLVRTGLFDVVGHLDLPKKFGHRLDDRRLVELAKPVMDAVAAAGMAVELNSGGLRKPVAEIYPSAPLLALAREREIPVCFGSDAHRPEEVGAGFDKAVALARDAGYTRCARFEQRSRRLVELPAREVGS